MVFAANTDAALRRYLPLAEIAIAWRDMQGSNGENIQLQIRIDQIVEALEEDGKDAEPNQDPGRCGGHPVDVVRPACPPIPVRC